MFAGQRGLGFIGEEDSPRGRPRESNSQLDFHGVRLKVVELRRGSGGGEPQRRRAAEAT